MNSKVYPAIFVLACFSLHITLCCSSSWAQTRMKTGGFPEIAHMAADVLEHNLRADISRVQPILFSSFVDMSDLNTTSVLGRMLGEQIGSRFSGHGYNVMELRLRKDSLYISPETGQMALSMNMKDIRGSWNAQAVITGTYHVVDDLVMVSARIVSTRDNAIISWHDFSFRLDSHLMTMTRPDHRKAEAQKPEKIEPPRGPLSTGAIVLNPSRSTDARIIQNRLAELGLYLDRVDGIWGRNSRMALERFKSEHQLAHPEKWDMPTQIRLFQGTGQ